MTVLSQISHAVGHVLDTFFVPDSDVMSNEARMILSNPKDREEYLKAVEKLKEDHSQPITIKLSNGEEITLIS